MTSNKAAIKHDFVADKVSNTGPVETMGMALMRLAAKATRPLEYSGLTMANRLITSVLPSDRMILSQLLPDTSFEFPYGDGYWGCLLDTARTYSPEEEQFLHAIRDIDYAYIDGGANYGYMSCLVSSETYGSKPAIAIEADKQNYEKLRRNWEINDKRFDIRNNALFSKSGEWVNIGGGKHEARAIEGLAGNATNGDVETLAIDDLSGWINEKGAKHLVIKLDVEGVEIDALDGAKRMLEQDPCLLFEDHAMDKTHEVSRFMKDNLGMRLFLSQSDGCREILRIDELDDIKKNPRVGYDFIAVRGSFWPGKVESLRYA